MSLRHRLPVGLLALGLNVSAVAAPQTLPMPIAQDLPVEIVVTQQELAVDVSDVAGAVGVQFGLIGALIGSAIENEQAKKAEAAVVPLRDMLVEYRFDEKLEQALRSKLVSDGISRNPSFTVLKSPWEAVDAQNSQHVPMQALVIVPRYAIDSGMNQLSVQLSVSFVDREIKSNGKIKAKATFSRTYMFHLPLEKEAGVANIARWQAFGKDRFAALLDEGIAQTTDMLVYDMSAQGRAEWPMHAKSQSVAVKDQNFAGVMVLQQPNWVWLRTGWSRMQSMQGYEPVDEHDALIAVVVAGAPASAVAAPTLAATAMPPATVATTGAPMSPAAATAPTTQPVAAMQPASMVPASASKDPQPAASGTQAGAASNPQPADANGH